MAVRFVPVNPVPAHAAQDRENLADVIDLRAKIAEQESLEEETLTSTLADATKILARKAMSSGELRKALQGREHAEESIDDVIARFEQRNFLDDTSLAEALTEKLRRTQHASSQHIARKLGERLIPRDVIDTVLSEIDREEETELMREVAEARARKLTSLDRATAERRLAGYLQRRGWGGSQLRDIIREALDNASVT